MALTATAALTGKETSIAAAVAYLLKVPVDKVQVTIDSAKVSNIRDKELDGPTAFAR